MINNKNSSTIKARYKKLNKLVKAAVKFHKTNMLKERIEQLEHDFKHNNSHNLFKIVKELEDRPKKSLQAVLDKNGIKHTNKTKNLACWKEHFEEHSNKIFPHDPNAIDRIPVACK